jgi:hypothetical protein
MSNNITILSPGDVTLESGSVNSGTINANCIVTDTSSNSSQGTIVGDCLFSGHSNNAGTIAGHAIFTEFSTNTGVVSGSTTINNGASSSGTISGNVIINVGGSNSGAITGNVTVYGSNSGAVFGDVTVYGTNTGNVTGNIVVKSTGNNSGNASGTITNAEGGTNTGQAGQPSEATYITWGVTLADNTSGSLYTTTGVTDLNGATMYTDPGLATLAASYSFNYAPFNYATDASGICNSYVSYSVTNDNNYGVLYSHVGFTGAAGEYLYTDNILTSTYTGFYSYSGGNYYADAGELKNYRKWTMDDATTVIYTGVVNDITAAPVYGDAGLTVPVSGAIYIYLGITYSYNGYTLEAADGYLSTGYYSGGYTTTAPSGTPTTLVDSADGLYYTFSTTSAGAPSLANGYYSNGYYSAGVNVAPSDTALTQTAIDDGKVYYYNSSSPTLADGAYNSGYYTAGVLNTTYNNNTPQIPQDNLVIGYYVYSSGVASPASGYYSNYCFISSGNTIALYSYDVAQAQDDNKYYYYDSGVAVLANGPYRNGYYTAGAFDISYNNSVPQQAQYSDPAEYYTYSNGAASAASGAYSFGYLDSRGNITTTYNTNIPQQVQDDNNYYTYFNGSATMAAGAYSSGYFIRGVKQVNGDGQIHQAQDNGSWYMYGVVTQFTSGVAQDADGKWYDFNGAGNGILFDGYYSTGYYVQGVLTAGDGAGHQAKDDNNLYIYSTTPGVVSTYDPAAAYQAWLDSTAGENDTPQHYNQDGYDVWGRYGKLANGYGWNATGDNTYHSYSNGIDQGSVISSPFDESATYNEGDLVNIAAYYTYICTQSGNWSLGDLMGGFGFRNLSDYISYNRG